MNGYIFDKKRSMKLNVVLVLMIATIFISACTATGEEATMESTNQAIADSIINAASSDSAGAPIELSPEAEEQH